jgi:hypothetical protein
MLPNARRLGEDWEDWGLEDWAGRLGSDPHNALNLIKKKAGWRRCHALAANSRPQMARSSTWMLAGQIDQILARLTEAAPHVAVEQLQVLEI